MRVRIINQAGWTASFITTAQVSRTGDMRKSSGMLLAMPLQCDEDTSKRVLDVRYSKHRCMTRLEWCAKLMNPGGTRAVFEAPVDIMPQWRDRFIDSRSQVLGVCGLRLMNVTGDVWRPASVRWAHGRGSGTDNLSEKALDMLWCAYVRGKCRELGMPEDMTGMPPEDFAKKLLAHASTDAELSEVTWQVACKSLCNVQTIAGKKDAFEFLGPSEEPVEVGMLADVWHAPRVLKRATVGLAKASDLLSGAFDYNAYEQGLTREEFLFRQPGVLEDGFQWYRLDKIWPEDND